MALSLERYPPLEISVWGAFGQAHAAGGDKRGKGVSPASCAAILARQGRRDACRSHDRARLHSARTPFASPKLPQSGTAILAVTASGHRLEAYATVPHRRQMGNRPRRGKPQAIPPAQVSWFCLFALFLRSNDLGDAESALRSVSAQFSKRGIVALSVDHPTR